MTLKDIATLRLANQHIAANPFTTPQELVAAMGAMQAQDFAMTKWAVGARLPGLTAQAVEKAISEGEVLRTHVLRPTWHLVSPDDIYSMLALTAPRIKSSTQSRDRDLGLNEATFAKSYTLIEKALVGGNHLTREEIALILNHAGIITDNYRIWHIMMHAELEGLVCSGAVKNNKQTYALLAERAPNQQKFHKEEALAVLAERYFTSHGPATLHDFVWWSGLGVTDARKGLEMAKHALVSDTVANEVYWFPASLIDMVIGAPSVYLLPAFDEFLISYRDRSASINSVHNPKAISSNGVFRPVVVIDGQVTGLWKRSFKKEKVMVEVSFFQPHDKRSRELIEEAAHALGHFLERKAEVKFNDGFDF